MSGENVGQANEHRQALTIGELALSLAEKGLPVFPCDWRVPNDKKPLTPNGFKDATTNLDTVRKWWRDDPLAMIGVPMGARSGLLAIDPDAPDAKCPIDGRAEWQRIASENGMPHPHTRIHATANGGLHVLYNWRPERPIRNTDKALGQFNIHVRGEGGYIIWPGSVNSDGLTYSVLDKRSPIEAPEWLYALLMPKPNGAAPHEEGASHRGNGAAGNGYDVEVERTRTYIDTAYYGELDRVRGAPPKTRNNTLNEAAFKIGTLMVGSHLTEAIVTAGLTQAAQACGLHTDPNCGWAQIAKTIRSGLDAGLRAPPRNLNHVVGPNASRFRNGAGEGRNEPAPILPPADKALDLWLTPLVPSFPFDLIPDPLQAYARTMAELSGVDPTACGMSMLMMISGTLDHRVQVKLKSDFTIGPNLWAMIVGEISSRKSFGPNVVKEFLTRYDVRDAILLKQKQDADKALGLTVDDDEVSRRRYINDTTSEKLCTVLAKQDCGITLVRDELSGLFGAMYKYGGGAKGSSQDRSVFLSGYYGGSYFQERMGRSTRIDNLSIGIFGSIQMEHMRKFSELDTDGMLQRFAPVMIGPVRDFNDDVEAEYEAHREEVVKLLHRIDLIEPQVFTVTKEAREVYREVDRRSLRLGEAGKIISPAYAAWAGKTPKVFGALCVVFQAIRIALGTGHRDEPISAAVAQAAADFIERFLRPHAEQFYEALSGNSGQNNLLHSVADSILRWEQSEGSKPISLRDLVRSSRPMRKLESRQEREEVMAFLVEAGWLTPVRPDDFRNRNWFVTPGLLARFASHREQRAAWLAELKMKMSS